MSSCKHFRMTGTLTIKEKKHNIVSTCKFLAPEKKKRGGFFGLGKKQKVDPKELNKVDIVIKQNDKIVSIGQ